MSSRSVIRMGAALGLWLALALPGQTGPQETEAAMNETIGEAMLTEGTGTQQGLDKWLVAFRDRALAAGILAVTATRDRT